MDSLTLTLTIPTPKPVPVPDGYPKATIGGLLIADVSGRICGRLAIGDLDLGFEAGEDATSALIEDPRGEWGEYSEHPNLDDLLPEGGDDCVYRQYLRDVIFAADNAYRQAAGLLLDEADMFISAGINGEG